MMVKQKNASYCVAANYLVIAAYMGTLHSSKFARLVSDDFCLTIPDLDIFESLLGFVIF